MPLSLLTGLNRTFAGRPRFVTPALMVIACVAYYLGSLVGLQLRLPPATTSVFWPPNALLTSILILTAPARWGLVLLAALPAHLFLELRTGWSLTFVFALFATNCFEALVGAGALRFLSDQPQRFDTLRRLTALVVAGVGAATLSSYADAAAVAWLHDGSYWDVWQARLFSNTLAVLTVVPAIVGGVTGWPGWWSHRQARARWIEAVALAASVCAIAWVDFGGMLMRIPALSAVSSQTPLAVQLPFLMWAAFRFGPAGTSLILLITTLFNAWAVVHGEGPFRSIPPGTTVTALTLSLIFVVATLLSLATLIEERRVTQHRMRRRLEFDRLLSRLSANLMEMTDDEMLRVLDRWLGAIASVLDLDALTVFAARRGSRDLVILYSWRASARRGDPRIASDHGAWARQSLVELRPFVVGGDTPEPASNDSVAGAIPLANREQPLGAVAFRGPVEENGADVLTHLRIVGEVLASALGRKRSEEALKESELMKSAILESLTSGVAVIDRAGRILDVNHQWTLLANESRWLEVGFGGNLLEHLRGAVARGDKAARGILSGVAGVLDGSRSRFTVDHSTGEVATARWWSITAVPLNRSGGGAVLTRADVTDLHRAEMEAERSRQHLAHVSRVSTIGEMTASIAHELNQPLSAILTNTQVARRMLEASAFRRGAASGTYGARTESSTRPSSADVVELRAILNDIEADNRRASDVIVRLRNLMRKGEPDMTWFDLDAAIHDVVQLVRREAASRQVVIAVEGDRGPLVIQGDRVQLQQVVLNLLQNSMEAMSGQSPRARRIVIRERKEDHRIRIRVHDSGPGLPPGGDDVLFEPFRTTKTGGMGMGLSIARSIIEAHGGSIHAVREEQREGEGAIFEFVLPIDVHKG